MVCIMECYEFVGVKEHVFLPIPLSTLPPRAFTHEGEVNTYDWIPRLPDFSRLTPPNGHLEGFPRIPPLLFSPLSFPFLRRSGRFSVSLCSDHTFLPFCS